MIFSPSLKRVIFSKRRTLWNAESENSKLKQIKSTIDIWTSSFQRERCTEVVLSQLRIGLILLTHGYLMNTSHDPVPQCTHCRPTLNVKHIFTDCPALARQRMVSIGNKNVKDILSDSPTFSTYPTIKL